MTVEPTRPTRKGGCNCGALRYEFDGDPAAVFCCHCTVCQRRTGSAFGISVAVPAKSFRKVQGELTSWASDAPTESGNQLDMQACAACGTRCWANPASNPRIVVVFGGTLDEAGTLQPTAHIHTGTKQAWFAIPDGLYRADGEPDWRQVFK